MKQNILILPGYGNSGEEHWQTLWEKENPHCQRVIQEDWLHPEKEKWVKALKEKLLQCEGEIILVAHSMACLVVAHWVNEGIAEHQIKGALLVGAPDPQSASFPKEAKGFESVPSRPFPFPSIVVASTNDVYATLEFAQNVAKSWGSDFVNIGAKGHINATSALGSWEEGKAILKKLL